MPISFRRKSTRPSNAGLEEEGAGGGPRKKRGMFKTIMRFLFSHLGLCILVSAYAALGAWGFYSIEGPDELSRANEGKARAAQLEAFRKEIHVEVLRFHNCFQDEERDTELHYQQDKNATKTEILLYMARRKCRNDQVVEGIKAMLDEYQRNVSDAIMDYGYDGTVPEKAYVKWTFSSAVVFTVTSITLIGYGHIAPTGQIGRVVLILYSLLGIPLTLMFLANIGKVFAAAIRFGYGKGCCYLCYKERKRHDERYILDAKGTFSHRKGEPAPEGFVGLDGRPSKAGLRPSIHGHEVAYSNEMTAAQIAEGLMAEDEATDILRDGDQPVPIALTIGIVLLYVVLGAVMFSAWEGWSLITASYFSFVTLTTMGFGDLVPGFTDNSTMGQFKLFVAAIYIIMGLAVLSMGFDLIIGEILAKARKVGKLAGVVEMVDEDGDGIDDEEQNKGNIGQTMARYKRHKASFAKPNRVEPPSALQPRRPSFVG